MQLRIIFNDFIVIDEYIIQFNDYFFNYNIRIVINKFYSYFENIEYN